MSADRGQLGIISCRSGKKFAEAVVEYLKEKYHKEGHDERFKYIETTETHFANGEIKFSVDEPIRGMDVYVIQLMDDPLSDLTVNDNLMALGTALNATFNSDADSITAVIPQFPNSRQERRKGRESVTASIIASFIENCGANRVLTIDIHAEAIAGFFHRARLDNLHASRQLMGSMLKRELIGEDTVVVAPDVGSAETARYYSRELKTDMALIVKERDYSKASTVVETRLVGDVADKNVVIVDDMVATGGTLIAACSILKEFGAKEIDVFCTFPFFNGNAVEKLDAAHKMGIIRSVTGTNAVWRGEDFIKDHPWYKEVRVTRLFAKVIYSINHMKSISNILES
ncbi:MAG TPA: ribose-phosphate pyrophosphokinase [bacterium]|nr:ribose-phosphate pyrophosphokinase [bacterium]